jgi:hypothetical protein
MNSREMTEAVERAGIKILAPYFREQESANGVKTFWLDGGGPIADLLQRQKGDMLFQFEDHSSYSIELKHEERHTGNIFLETYSWKKRGVPGWLWTTKADLLGFHFINAGLFYLSQTKRIVEFAESDLFEIFRERPQGKYPQPNDTWGRCVPVRVLKKECGLCRIDLRQLEMFNHSPLDVVR